ncbi:hypothetical protein HHK36_015067 [Tetracentron sinense]|uniref:Protein MIS12 homolog n=1 Tax=Tetracentron sinense TaxID=13715 RepID=A0A834ZAB5_TETSI|nr:hypothetical protein HHK36_015067 [Tetracentron sinense]
MEGSESEAIFDSLNLNPQLFINEVLNSVDDLVDGAFEFYEQYAFLLLFYLILSLDLLVFLKTGRNCYSEKLAPRKDNIIAGISSIRNMVQANLDKRLGMWEKYCLRHCFVVPEGFELPKAVGHGHSGLCPQLLEKVISKEAPGDTLMDQDALCDPELDAELDSLRKKLAVVGKESAELNRELRALERQSVLSNNCVGSVNEALQLYEQNSVHDMFQEMIRTSSELRMKMGKLKTKRMEEIENIRAARIYNPNGDMFMMHHNKGLSNVELEELQEFAADVKNI